MPMTPSLRDGKAPALLPKATPTMNDESNIEDVEQDVNSDKAGGFEPQIGDLDTAEGQARRAEEAHLEEMWEDAKGLSEDLDPLPKPEDAKLGELCQIPEGGQFEDCSLLGGNSGDLIEVITEGEPNDTAESFYEALGPKVDGTPEGGWRGIATSNLVGWGWETPVGTVPMGLMEPGEVLDFLEEAEKPWPKEDPRRSEGGEGQ